MKKRKNEPEKKNNKSSERFWFYLKNHRFLTEQTVFELQFLKPINWLKFFYTIAVLLKKPY